MRWRRRAGARLRGHTETQSAATVNAAAVIAAIVEAPVVDVPIINEDDVKGDDTRDEELRRHRGRAMDVDVVSFTKYDEYALVER